MINHYNHSFLSDHTQNYSVCLGTEVLILLDSKVETSHVHLKLFHLKKGFWDRAYGTAAQCLPGKCKVPSLILCTYPSQKIF